MCEWGTHIKYTSVHGEERKGKTDEGKEQGAAEWVLTEGFMEGVVSKLHAEGCKAGPGKGWWEVRGTESKQAPPPSVWDPGLDLHCRFWRAAPDLAATQVTNSTSSRVPAGGWGSRAFGNRSGLAQETGGADIENGPLEKTGCSLT